MFVKIGRINIKPIFYHYYCYSSIKNAKKNYINIAFHNFKIKCAQNKTELTFQNC